MDFDALYQQVMAGPGEEEKKRAMAQALAAAGFGILGSRTGKGWQGALNAAGQGGLLGMNVYNNELTGARQDRRQGLLDAVSMYGLNRQMESDKRADQQRAALEAARSASVVPGAPGSPQMGPPTAQGEMQPAVPPTPPSFDFAGYASRIAPVDPAMALQVNQAMAKESPFDKPKPEHYTPASLAKFAQSRNPADLVLIAQPDASPVAKPSAHEFTPESIQAFVDSGGKNWSLLKRLPPQTPAGEDAQPMTKEAITNAAMRYNIDGTLPPMGMGRLAGSYRSAILNEAARLNEGVSPEDQRLAQIENKGSTAALAQIQRSEAQVGAFEKNFTKNADLALQLSKQIDNSGVPLVNRWVNAGKRAITGDATLSAYDAAIKTAVNEYSKILSGSMGNQQMAESEVKKVEALLNAAQTRDQVESVISLMKKETQNRMTGFKEQKKELIGGMRKKKVPDNPDDILSAADAILGGK